MNTAPHYVFRTEPGIDSQGRRTLTIYRRKVLTATDDVCELAEVERAVVHEGEPPVWQRPGGLLGRPVTMDRKRLASSGYSDKAPKEVQRA